MKLIDLTGNKYGRLTVVQKAHREKTHLYWLCECQCGNEKLISGNNLKKGVVNSCGCLQKEVAAKSMKIQGDKTTHGMSRTPEYYSWKAMKERCSNENHKAYKNYGGRGITVCERWANSFEHFLVDMGARPDGLSLERIDNSKGYYKGNCKWADIFEQNQNRTFGRKNE